MKSLPCIQDLLKNWEDFTVKINQISKNEVEYPVNVEGIQGSFFGFFTSELLRKTYVNNLQAIQYNNTSRKGSNNVITSQDLLIIVPSEYEANNLYNDLTTICENAEIFVFTAWGTVPYRPAATGSLVFGTRAGVLSKILNKNQTINFNQKNRIFIATQRSLLSALPKPDYLQKQSFTLSKKDQLDTTNIASKLAEIGYVRVPRVTVRGEFSLRGEVLDIFLPAEENAIRIIFDFDEIESIKTFDTDTQVTIENKESVLIYPMREIIWNDEFIETVDKKLEEYQSTAIKLDADSTDYDADLRFEKEIHKDKNVHLPFSTAALEKKNEIIGQLMSARQAEGEEFFYPLIWDKQYSLLDYFDPSTLVFYYDYDKMKNAILTINREYEGMYRKSRGEFPVFPPSQILFDFDNLVSQTQRCIQFRTIKADKDSDVSMYSFGVEASRSFFGNLNYMKEELTNLQTDGWNLFIYADNENQQLRLQQVFKEFIEIDPASSKKPLQLIPKAISAGFSIPDAKLLVIQENEIFGRRKYVPKQSTSKAKSKAIDTFVELNPGDYVVHVNHGIGLFHGIERVKSANNERDYIKLEYADKDYVFVPIEQVNLVQRYIGNEGDRPRLDTLGSKSWENRKNKVKKAVEDLAEKLIDLYSRRQASVGFAFPKETEWQSTFEAAFPYEDTPDQITVTHDVYEDMERSVPMDRLVCGDVGYGKTEIAMRSAFKAVMGGKQVAFLAPTTILAEQHYENCKERFKNFPVKIERMSRFVTPQEQKKILARLAEGDVDVLVGTHRIIQKDVKFKNLGLMIIDEEQRFGVKDKEKLKEMRNNIDCLTMSATPIPRTLHMSLLKIRDMSLLTTPPQNRQPIETVIDEYKDDRVAQAIRREIERGGQVFYLHNRVESLMEVRRKIEQICPEVLVDTAHGQMTSSELDDIFHRFKMGGFHVLIATTIIENGIDIPNVNTIIIDRADMYGVSQLYQLRGRVGRSDRQAYAYLLYPENKALSEIAMKRLQVISDFTELGSGFKIAMKDMEIRGAGNLLGRDQSGDVYSVGFDMYVRLLNEAVNRLAANKEYVEQGDVLMELEYTGFIPDTYIKNPQIKMEIYKKIAAIITQQEFDDVLSEISDRFGPVPDEVSSLLALAEIRIICKKLSVSSIKEKMGEVKVEFKQASCLSIEKLMKAIKDNPGVIRLNSALPNVIFIKSGKIGLKEKSEFIREKLNALVG